MDNKKEIFLRHGMLKKLSELTEVASGVCSRYLKGWYDDTNQEVLERALHVRETALSQCGGFTI